MKKFEYRISDPQGIHARPAGLLAKEAKAFTSRITIAKDGKGVACTRLMAVMGLGIRCGDTILITAEGSDEDAAIACISAFLQKNL
ncbi:MAG: HPr family phosphocarrier protein [Oscillospiraceae bacterium]|nr:HPr family phosphocarrier protein [Oscillospiraceae bacterium]